MQKPSSKSFVMNKIIPIKNKFSKQHDDDVEQQIS